MKKLLTVIILILDFGSRFAKFAKIVEKKGFVKLRKEANVKSKVIFIKTFRELCQ